MIEGMAFLARDYEEVRDWLATVFDAGSAGQYLIDVLDDAIAADLSGVVSLTTSMHDLVFSPTPVDNEVEAVIVRAPGSLHSPRSGNVRVDVVRSNHETTRIERPSADAIAVFWAAMRDSFGVSRNRSGDGSMD